MLIELSEKDKKKAARQEEADYKEHVIGCLEELCDEVIEHGLSSERVADIIDFRRDEVHAEDWKKCLRTARGKKLPRAVVDPLLERLCA